MIAFISGELAYANETQAVVDVNGVGYAINISTATCAKMPRPGEPVKIYTYTSVKEDGIALYGFMTQAELDMFNILITVSGVGPKAAQALLSVTQPPDIAFAIVNDDIPALSRAPGIGKKTAGRLILELKEKFISTGAAAAVLEGAQAAPGASSEKQDALDALAVLGYSRAEAMKAVLEVSLEGMTAEQIIKQSLKKLAGV